MGAFAAERGVRLRGNSSAPIATIRQVAQEVDLTMSYAQANSLQDSIDHHVRPWQSGANIFGLMGLLALCVAAIRLYIRILREFESRSSVIPETSEESKRGNSDSTGPE